MAANLNWLTVLFLSDTLSQRWTKQRALGLFLFLPVTLCRPHLLAAGGHRLLVNDPRLMGACVGSLGKTRALVVNARITAAILTATLAANGVLWQILVLVAHPGATVLLVVPQEVAVVVLMLHLLYPCQCQCQCLHRHQPGFRQVHGL